MGCLLELLLEVIFEGVIGGYFYLMTLIAPEKASNPKVRNALKTIAVTVAGILLVVLVIGIFASFSVDAQVKAAGKYMVLIPLIIILTQMVLGILLRLIVKRKQ